MIAINGAGLRDNVTTAFGGTLSIDTAAPAPTGDVVLDLEVTHPYTSDDVGTGAWLSAEGGYIDTDTKTHADSSTMQLIAAPKHVACHWAGVWSQNASGLGPCRCGASSAWHLRTGPRPSPTAATI